MRRREHATVGFELGLALAAAHADAADLPREVSPLAGQPRQLVVEARELDLGARLAAARPPVENLEDHAAAVDHLATLSDLLEVLGLRAGEVLVEQHDIDAQLGQPGGDLLGLAAPDVESRIGGLARLDRLPDDLGACRVGERGELVEMLVDVAALPGQARRRRGRRGGGGGGWRAGAWSKGVDRSRDW